MGFFRKKNVDVMSQTHLIQPAIELSFCSEATKKSLVKDSG
jgi:hypothetical protein